VKSLPAGSTVTVKCKSPRGTRTGKCPRSLVKGNLAGTFNLTSFTKRKLRAGTILEVRVSGPGATTLVKTLKLRPRKSPQVTTKCVLPGQTALTACPG